MPSEWPDSCILICEGLGRRDKAINGFIGQPRSTAPHGRAPRGVVIHIESSEVRADLSRNAVGGYTCPSLLSVAE